VGGRAALEGLSVNDPDEERARQERLAQIRTAIASGDPVVVRIHPHFNVAGFVAYIECGERRIFGCTLTYQALPESGADLGIVVMEKRQRPLVNEGDPEHAVRLWLAKEFLDLERAHVSIERYVAPDERRMP
jgi:hypothetical protein